MELKMTSPLPNFMTWCRLGMLAALAGAPLTAHDFWIEPATFSPQSGQILGVRLRVGQDLLGDPVPRDPALVQRFDFEDAAGRRPLVGRTGADPAGLLRVDGHGLLVIGYLSNPSPIEMDAQKFNQYLKDEGLDAIAAFRDRRKQTGDPGREIFSRCAKSLVLSGSPDRTQADRLLGLTLELLAERNPYTIRPGEDLPVRLVYANRPIAGVLVVAINRLNPAEKQLARTDSEGRARLRLKQGGMWLVKAVHMVPAPAGTHADWASYWASLTFELPNTVAARN
jgi:uncharacterized GH25 family protein